MTNIKALMGRGGTGKSYRLREMATPEWLLTSSSGISSVNLGCTTIHSALRFFNEDSLERALNSGAILDRLDVLRRQYRVIALDELSMISAQLFSLLIESFDTINSGEERQLSLYLVGDCGQLPPVKGEWIFTAPEWERVEIERLTQVYRQTDPLFIAALDAARIGEGEECAKRLVDLEIEFLPRRNVNFEGTTIFALNDEVDEFNSINYRRLTTYEFTLFSKKRGYQLAEWRKIPHELKLRDGARVMILSNDTKQWTFTNGDCGIIVDYSDKQVFIKLDRNDVIVAVGSITRVADEMHPKLGSITYHPLRLAYASTIHKVQGLTLDRVQLCPKARFFGSPNAAYVALTRARDPQHLSIVGTPKLLAQRIVMDPAVSEWI